MGLFYIFFPCTERGQIPTHRIAELSQGPGVCAKPQDPLFLVPILHGSERDVSILYVYNTDILYALVLYGGNLSMTKRVHLHRKPHGY